MLAMNSPRRHPPDALLHQYAAGELDPAHRTAISSHLEGCAECRASERRVEGLRTLIADHPAPGFDELKWRRISQGVMSQLEREARTAQQGFGYRARAQWTMAGLAAVAAVALLVWFAPRPQRQKAVVVEKELIAVSAPTITSGDRPFDVQLPPALQLHLSEGARVLAKSTVPENIELELQLGELDVRALAPIDPRTPIKIYTPEMLAIARSSDFSIGYRANESFVAVREGEVELQGPAFPEKTIVEKGERRVIQKTPTEPSAHHERIAKKLRAPLLAQEKRPAKKIEAPVMSEHANEQRAEEPGQARLEPKNEDTFKSSSEGVTSVQMIKPPEDPWAKKLREANEQYSARNYKKAIALASEIVKDGGLRPELWSAKEILCDLYIATGDAEKSIHACTALLDVNNIDASRHVHYKLATIHRAQLDDCKTAIGHYTRSIVFGRQSMLDDEALLWRAHCEIEIGDLAAARFDVAALESRGAALARPEELLVLKKRLISGAKSPTSRP
jgi:ferric-dicitrate binding protein FerR (iron transport regulator)